jgi:hypothetical protein
MLPWSLSIEHISPHIPRDDTNILGLGEPEYGGKGGVVVPSVCALLGDVAAAPLSPGPWAFPLGPGPGGYMETLLLAPHFYHWSA